MTNTISTNPIVIYHKFHSLNTITTIAIIINKFINIIVFCLKNLTTTITMISIKKCNYYPIINIRFHKLHHSPLTIFTKAFTFTITISTTVFFHHQCQLLSCLRLLLVYLLVP